MEKYKDIFIDKMKELYQTLLSEFEKVIKIGLMHKGYDFENDKELLDFAAKHCECQQVGNERTYYVKSMPFLMYVENREINYNSETDTCVAELGRYRFI